MSEQQQRYSSGQHRGGDDARTVAVQIRLTPAEHEKLMAAATRDRRRPAEYARLAVMDAVDF